MTRTDLCRDVSRETSWAIRPLIFCGPSGGHRAFSWALRRLLASVAEDEHVLVLLEILTVLLVAVAMGLALAHALELPGKLRLSRDTYLQVQHIYYPGFTVGGAVGELGGLIALLLLLLVNPILSDGRFWLTLAAFLALAAMHAVYWLLTHPVNNFWLKDFELKGAAGRFFRAGRLMRHDGSGAPEWTDLRDQWEYSHVIRAALGLLSLVLITWAVAV